MKSKHTDEQLGWLRSHLAEYETRAGGNVRGDAKKFALEKAAKYIEKWGVPDGEKETTMKEQIYTWFKNTSARGKEARKRHQLMKKAERPSTAYLTVPNIEQPGQSSGAPSQLRYQQQQQQQQQQQPPPPPPGHYPPPSAPPPGHYAAAPPALSPYACTIRDALLNPACGDADVAAAMQLCPDMPDIAAALFAAAVLVTTAGPPAAELGDPLQHVVRRFAGALAHWPRTMAFRGFSGARAGRHLLRHAVRTHAAWRAPCAAPCAAAPHDMQDELARLALDRTRKRDHVLWARVHAAALELGLVEDAWLAETLANDAMWEADEVEWVGGCVLLRGLVRAGKAPTDAGTGGWSELMHRYQAKWKEVRDEGRQALMAETLLDIRKTLEGHARM